MSAIDASRRIDQASSASWRVKTTKARFIAACLILLALVGVLLCLHVFVGTVGLTPTQVTNALFGRPEEALHGQIVVGLRLPRALVAVVAGAMIGLSGAILQSMTRNPLAEAGLLGVSAGGVLAVVMLIVTQGGRSPDSIVDSGVTLPFVAMAGGLTAGTLTYALSWQQGSDPARLILSGVLVGGMCSAMTSVLILWANEHQLLRVVHWTIGSTAGRVWSHWHTLWPFAIAALPLGMLSAGLANALQLGDDVASGLGVHLQAARGALLLVSVMLDVSAVAVVGPIGFIGLIGPHIARMMFGGDARRLFPLSALTSAALLIASDILARTLTLNWVGGLTGLDVPDNAGIPVGAVTALLGAPFFLYLLLRRKA